MGGGPSATLGAPHPATRRGGIGDTVASLVGFSCISLPGFWVAILLLYLFSLYLGWLPSSGFVRLHEDWVGSLKSSIMPAIALGLRPAGIFMRLVRSSMLEAMKSDYVRTARAKGLTAFKVTLRHGLRTSLIPLVTVLSVEFAALLGNVVVIDTIFGLPGFGRLARATFLSQQHREYVVAARTLGVSNWKIMVRHILPNAIDPIIVQGAVFVVAAVFTEAALSIVGLGLQPPEPSLGILLNVGMRYITMAPFYILGPTLILVLLALAFSLLADALNSTVNRK